jgi:hypothetical protein
LRNPILPIALLAQLMPDAAGSAQIVRPAASDEVRP